MRHFAAERVTLAAHAVGIAQRCLDLTIDWTRARTAFGEPLSRKQVVRHRLAEMATRLTVAREYVFNLARRMDEGEHAGAASAIAKNTAVAACSFVVDAAVQLFGGAGYVEGYEVERHYRDARILGIGGGTTEIMNEIIARAIIDSGSGGRP
jgi:acyl-CoA dehydrogenase